MGLQSIILNTAVNYGKKGIKKLLPPPQKVKGLLEYKPLVQAVEQTSQKYGKHKVPRYIYHLTSKTNYESMLRDGYIKAKGDTLIGRGVFATELTNLFKRWRKDKSWEYKSLQESLIYQASKNGGDIVILKIPTESLNQDLLRIRSQNTLFKWAYSSQGLRTLDRSEKEFKQLPKENHNWLTKSASILKKLLLKTENRKTTEHLTEGAPAKDAHLFTQKKQAIEYIYKDDIPILDVEKIGEVDVRKLRRSPEYDRNFPIRSIFTALLKGQPEVKGAQLLNC